jgi:hypothetical protein
MSHPRLRPGGTTLFREGEKALVVDINDVGTIGLQSLYNGVLARLCLSGIDDNPIQGFPGSDCLVTATGLTATIAAGMGMYYDTAATDAFGMIYRPIMVSAPVTQAINAHDATNPRIDIICLAPDTVDDQNALRMTMDPTTEAITDMTVAKRRRLSYALSYTAGTPAGVPTAPTTPSGYIKIAEIRVPPVSGAVSVDDFRPRLSFGHSFVADPPQEYAALFVPGSGSELAVTQTPTPGLRVLVSAGAAVLYGFRYQYPRQVATIAAADPTNPRIDVVYAGNDGLIGVATGTPAGSPVAPSFPFTAIALAHVAVGATVTSILNADITDVRERLPITGAQIRDGAVDTAQIADDAVTNAKLATASVDTSEIVDSAVIAQKLATNSVITAKINAGAVTATKLSVVPVIPALTVGAENGSDEIVVSIQAKDPDGNNVARTVRLELEILDINGNVYPGQATYKVTLGTGAAISPTHALGSGVDSAHRVIDTDASGVASVTVKDMSGGANRGVFLRVTPLNTWGSPALADLGFN